MGARSNAARAHAVALAVLVLGCNAILGIDSGHPKATDAGDHDATPSEDATAEGGAQPSDAPVDMSTGDDVAVCADAHAPPRPSKDDDPMRVEPTMVMAVETFQFEDDGSIGLDLDDRCTVCPEATSSSCVLRSQPTVLVCDGVPGGRDRTGNLLLSELVRQGETAFSQEELQRKVNEGVEGVAIRIGSYNGRANDQAVTVEFFGKAWMPAPEGGPQPIPQRDGTDTWTVYEDTVTVGSVALQQDISAYVNNYVLVARLPQASVALRPGTGTNDNPFVVELRDVIITGTLVPTDQGFRIEAGNLAGRWPGDLMLKSFSALATDMGSVCGSNPFYVLLKINVCAALDVMRDRVSDNMNKPCDAISLGLGFTAGAARIAVDPKTPYIEPNNCGDDWSPTCD